jgi:hypothetical protein
MGSFDGCYHRVGAFGWLKVLPESYHMPSGISQQVINKAITPHVSRQFGGPVVRVARGPAPVAGARVPEATVNEDGKAKTGEYDVWSH